ncbi:heme/hemin ABC transporter substrate-binding protein [Rhodophyticola sp. CCM32]|uniref:heme/hemin ABC transporter substrate-binding protein n=1 Tax=Rhodophyticola sp. CCM32 TaxID=2916397 RepID=UPI001EE4EC4B|nr:ABC transporter substrate-binding protein [Rhodophyticola sp. CCM32]
MISGTSVQAQDDDRVLAIGGSVTEIIYALGQQDRLVARDTTSSFPPEAEALPDVGYMRALSPEGVLSVNPDLVIAEAGSGPPETIEVLEEAAINFVMVPDGYDRASIGEKIRAVAAALGVDAAGEDLAAEVDADLAEAEAAAATGGTPPRVLFILSMQGGRILASGTDTGAAGIIALAGGENAVTEFDGYKPLTDEAVTALAPDVILMMDRQGDHSAADAELFSHPALSTTPAAQTGSVVRMDGLLMLGFGPRTPEAVRALSAAFDEARG